MRGVVTSYDLQRQFGFIRGTGATAPSIFFHASNIVSGREHLGIGARATFSVAQGEKGLKAIGISLAKPAVNPHYFFLGAALFLLIGILIIESVATSNLLPVLKYVIAINGALFILTGLDKASSYGSASRVPERIFYLCAGIGGSLGLLLGMKFFRHKTRKANFKFFLAVIVIVQILALRLLFPDWSLRNYP